MTLSLGVFPRFRVRFFFLGLIGVFLLIARAGPAHAQDASPTPEVEPGRFGVIESYEDPAAADRLGATWTRVRFQWADVQPDGPDSWNPPLDDEALAAELAAGRMVVGLIIGIPDWARTRQGLPRGLYLPADDPDNTWAVFIADIVDRYEGRIDHWIIWNEPDIDDVDAPGHTWDGSIEDYFELQRTAYLVAKDVNPNAVIHLGAFTYYWDPGYFRRFLDVVATDPAAAENGYYFDVATAHLYFQPSLIYTIIDVFYKVMATHHLDKPIWLVETNAPPIDDPYWMVPNWTLAVSLNEQAAFIPQALSAAMAAGAERIAVYKLKDTEGDRAANPEPFGLVRWDESRRPAYNTYRVAIDLLDGVTGAERERWDAVGQIRLEQAGRTSTVLFSRLPEPQTARVKATAETGELIDMWGRSKPVEAEDGFFIVELPGALCRQTIADYCMIGSTTYYLVQEAPSQAAARVTATPLPKPAVEPPATAGATPTAPPSPTPTLPSGGAVAQTEPPATVETVAGATTTVAMTVVPSPTDGVLVAAETERPSGPAGYSGLIVLGTALVLVVTLIVRQWSGNRRM